MQKYMKFGLLTIVLLLSAVMLTTIDGSQNSVQAQNITSTLLPSTLPPQDGTSVPTTPAQESSGGEDASSSNSNSVNNDAPESGDVSDSQEDAASSEGLNSVPITPSPKSSDNNDESSSNDGNNESSGSSESGGGYDNNDNDNDDNNNISSQDTSSNENNDSNTEGDVSSSDKEADETDDAFTDGKKKYGKSQVVTQVNACGNGDMSINIGCQNTASQIQGDDNRITAAAAQSFDD